MFSSAASRVAALVLMAVATGQPVAPATEDEAALLQISAGILRNASRPTVAGAAGATAAAPLLSRGRRAAEGLQAALRPLLAAVPRNTHGKVGGPAARYALHRLFLWQRGWRVEGLDPEGKAWNSSSLADVTVLRSLPAADLAGLLARWDEQGLDVQEVSLLAATIESLIHQDAVERLRAAYSMQGLPTDRAVDMGQAASAMDLCLASYIIGRKVGVDPGTDREVLQQYRQMDELLPSWNETRKWVLSVLEARARSTGASRKMVSFADATAAVEDVSDGHGRHQDQACHAMKSNLMSIEDGPTGRVRLADFYGEALGGKWQFQESESYLRQNGALDEANPGNLRVIIPNYVNGHSNCIGSSDFHSVCCISECEDLRTRVERALGRPEGTPSEIAEVIAALPSATVPARGTLDPVLRQRLHRIAGDNGGSVPIYGRLFAQWMHHAYPHECEYPHLAGRTSPLDVYDMEEAGLRVLAATDDMKTHAATKKRQAAPLESAPWVHREELLGSQDDMDARVPPLFVAFHAMVFVSASVGLAWLSRLASLGCRSSVGRRTRKAEALLTPALV